MNERYAEIGRVGFGELVAAWMDKIDRLGPLGLLVILKEARALN